MSTVNDTIDLTLYGCPLHYIKAREALSKIALEQQLLFKVNNGDAVDEVLKSLRHDGQLCEIITTDTLTTNIRVVKQNVTN